MNLTSVGQILSELDRNEVTMLLEIADGVDLQPIEAVLVECRGTCDLPPGSRLIFRHPAAAPDLQTCPALLRTLRPFLIAASLGIASDDGSDTYLVACPGQKGTVWRVQPLRLM